MVSPCTQHSRLAVAAILLTCFAWHLAAPFMVAATQVSTQNVALVTSAHKSDTVTWVPRGVDSGDLVRAPGRHPLPLLLARVRTNSRVCSSSVARRRLDSTAARRGTYPERRQRCRGPLRSNDGDQPA